jgi:hypothetical protein
MFKADCISLTDFHSQIQRQRQEIKQAWDSVSNICSLFDEEEDVYVKHCDQVKNALRIARDPIWGLNQLLHTPSRLPLTVVPHCFSLLITLRQMGELIDELLILITLFRRICRSTSRDMIERRQEIKRKLDMLAQGHEDILQQIDHLLLQVLAQEKAERQKLKSLIYSS